LEGNHWLADKEPPSPIIKKRKKNDIMRLLILNEYTTFKTGRHIFVKNIKINKKAIMDLRFHILWAYSGTHNVHAMTPSIV
jgi:hypothetical protein